MRIANGKCVCSGAEMMGLGVRASENENTAQNEKMQKSPKLHL